MKFKLLKEKLEETPHIVKEYRKYANLKEDDKIKKDSIDEWAFRKVCAENNCTEDFLMEKLLGTEEVLTEDTTLSDAAEIAREIDATKVTSDNKGQIESELDKALRRAQKSKRQGTKEWTNLLLIGEAGTGKTAIVNQWAKDKGVNLFVVRAAGMDDTDLGGALAANLTDKVAQRLASTEFDQLERPNSVLFLDEFNRAPHGVRTNLMELINNHIVPDPRVPGGQRYLDNFLFTVAAINPATELYNTDEMDTAELSRFKNIEVVPDRKQLLKWITKTLDDSIKQDDEEEAKEDMGRKNIATTLLNSREFQFDSGEDIKKSIREGNKLPLNYRTFYNLLQDSDGTKQDFLDNWNKHCNSLKKSMVERILHDYKDADDKANDALKQDTESTVFKKGVLDTIDDALKGI